MDKTIVIIIVAVILAGAGFWAWQSGFFTGNVVPPTPLPEGIVLFFGQDCPHCKIVEEFIVANNIDQKVEFTNLEIPFNGKTSPELVANSEVLVQVAKECKIDTSSGISIPFLFDGKQCLVGQDDIINFFKNKAGIN